MLNRERAAIKIHLKTTSDWSETKRAEKTLVEENGVLFETHSKAILKLLQQEDYKMKFDVLKEKTDALKQEITEKSQTVQGLNNDLEVLIDLKKNYKALKPEKAALIRQNKALKKNVRVLEKKVSDEQTYAGKNAVLQSEMVVLNLAKDTLQEQKNNSEIKATSSDGWVLVSLSGGRLDAGSLGRERSSSCPVTVSDGPSSSCPVTVPDGPSSSCPVTVPDVPPFPDSGSQYPIAISSGSSSQ
ncbi:hypothetical protein EYF80_015653 [Liparis tanakae]|uniref:Uncharacterized protein n=1 Tax=Liparis tanakae TaxID=230148 RepID=A0A4Z2I8C8_9TELE|nr:hypothetical protein EYF80_015653 [Liparis tanakae]